MVDGLTVSGPGLPAPVGSVPIVDLTALQRSLYEHAEACRVNATTTARLAARWRDEADLLEAVARVLDGTA